VLFSASFQTSLNSQINNAIQGVRPGHATGPHTDIRQN